MAAIGFARGTWTAGISLVGGGAVTVAPEGSLAWYAGYAMIVIGLLVLCWGITWRGQHWWLRVFEGVGVQRREMPPWLPFPRAIDYLMRESEWAYGAKPLSPDQANELIEREFLEKAARGEVACRGIPYSRDFRSPDSSATLTIEPSFWQHAFFQPFAELHSRITSPKAERSVAATDGKFAVHERARFMRIIVSSADLLSTWPRAEKSRRKSASPLAAAFAQYMAEGEKNPNWDFDEEIDMLLRYEPRNQ